MRSVDKLTRIEIVTPVHNRRDITLQCLKSLARIDRTGLEVHVIIVDDGSTDGTSEAIAEQFPETEIVHGDGSLWFTAGTNRGIEAAMKHDPEYVLTIKFTNGKERKAEVGVITPSEGGYYVRNEAGEILIVSRDSLDALLGMLTNPPFAATPTPSPIATETPLPSPTPEAVTPPTETATPQP